MKLAKFATITVLGLACASSFGVNPEEAAVRKAIEPRLDNAKILSVTKTPYSGLFEIRTDNNDIFYTDKKAQYLFVGRILNTATYEDYTKARIEEITRVKFSELPFDSALKMVKGDGKRVIALFEDPNCGYCKRFRQTTLNELDNVTVYTFMYNILSEDSMIKSKNVWCSADRNKAWDEWMLNNKLPPTAPAGCISTPNDKIFALGQKLKINGTPTIIFADGSRIPGAVDSKQIEAKLSTIK